MTRKDILKKHGFSWTSNVNLKEELSEQAVPEFLTKKRSRQMTRKVSCLHLVYGNIRESDLQI